MGKVKRDSKREATVIFSHTAATALLGLAKLLQVALKSVDPETGALVDVGLIEAARLSVVGLLKEYEEML